MIGTRALIPANTARIAEQKTDWFGSDPVGVGGFKFKKKIIV